MKNVFEFIHNVVAHPLLSVAAIADFTLALLFIIGTLPVWLIACKHPADLWPDRLSKFSLSNLADKFHDWTADRM
jgi:hypothetical protein